MKRKGFRYVCTVEEIRSHMKLSAKDKLAWLEAANRFCHKAIRGQTKKIWEGFRRGTV